MEFLIIHDIPPLSIHLQYVLCVCVCVFSQIHQSVKCGTDSWKLLIEERKSKQRRREREREEGRKTRMVDKSRGAL